MHWLVDHAGAVYVVLGLVTLALLAVFWVDRRVKFLVWSVGPLALMGLFWLLTLLVVTDRAQVRSNVQAMADAVVQGDADALFKYVARDFVYKPRGYDRDTMYQKVRQAIKHFNVTSIHVWHFEVTELSRDGDKGRAKVNFKVTVAGPAGERPVLCFAEFRREDGVWKMSELTRLTNPIANTEQAIDVPF